MKSVLPLENTHMHELAHTHAAISAEHCCTPIVQVHKMNRESMSL